MVDVNPKSSKYFCRGRRKRTSAAPASCIHCDAEPTAGYGSLTPFKAGLGQRCIAAGVRVHGPLAEDNRA
jgi:hypothetical protein